MHRQWHHGEADAASDTDAGFSSEVSRGMAALYLHLLQPDRSLRWPFMRTLIRCFDSASDLLTPGAAPADPRSVKAPCHCTGAVVIMESACRALLAIDLRCTTTLYVSSEFSVSPLWAAADVKYKSNITQFDQELINEAPDDLLTQQNMTYIMHTSNPQPVNLHLPAQYAICRLLSFCANVAACLPFKKCDEPHSLLHLINTTISRRGDFVMSAQKSSLEAASDAAPTTTQDPHAVPDTMNGVQQSDGLSVRIQADGTSAALPGDAEVTVLVLVDQAVSLLKIGNCPRGVIHLLEKLDLAYANA